MAPEQVRGTTDRTTDIYAASVVLWEALTGTRRFNGATDMEVFDKVMHSQVPPPSSLVPSLPAVLDEVTLRGLHRDPAQRFATAREMARRLEEAMPIVAASRIGEWVERTAGSVLDARAKRVVSIERDAGLRTATMPEIKADAAADPEPWLAGPPTIRSGPLSILEPEEAAPPTRVSEGDGDSSIDRRVQPCRHRERRRSADTPRAGQRGAREGAGFPCVDAVASVLLDHDRARAACPSGCSGGAGSPRGAQDTAHVTTVTLAVTPATATGMLELKIERPMAFDVSAPGYATTRVLVDGTTSVLRVDLSPTPKGP